MAEYVFKFSMRYDGTTDGSVRDATDDTSGSVIGDVSDGEFALNDTAELSFSPTTTLTYLGTANIDGGTWPVFDIGGRAYLYSTRDLTAFSDPLELNEGAALSTETEYGFVFSMRYESTTNGAARDATDDTSGTILGGDTNGAFEVGDPATIAGASGLDLTFLGTMEVDGTNWPVFDIGGRAYLYATRDLGGFTTPLNVDDSGSFAVCFASGTMIATAEGETAVEALAIGDMIRTASGGRVPVTWVGRQTLCKRFSGPRMQPVRFRAGALGNGLPHDDLTVTADHGMVIDGYVINASALVNGQTVEFVPLAELEDSFTVYHIETEAHDVILANGAPSETFIDVASRRNFDNYKDYLDRYGHERIIPAQPLPRISSARLVPEAIKAQLGRAQQSRACTA